MSLREWLILLGAVIVIGIIIDGIRRMHRARKDSLEISRGMGADQIDDTPIDEYNSELPNGGARIINKLGVSASQRAEAAARPLDPYEENDEAERRNEAPAEEALSADDLDDELPEDFSLQGEAREDVDRAWSGPAAADPVAEPTPVPEPPPRRTTLRTPSALKRGNTRPAKAGRPGTGPAARPEPVTQQNRGSYADRPLAGANRPPAKEVFVINVDCRSAEGFNGGDIRRLFDACGLEHGDMGIYHRHEDDDTHSPVQFSVANAVEPGTFDPTTMDGLHTPGISFFMSLPGPTDSLQAYDFMVETAQAVVRNLDGDLKDERRSVMTAQTIEHGRQRVREFERKRRSAKV